MVNYYAINSELKRHQIEEPKVQDTRRWNSIDNKTELMRTKENAADYRFIPDPDLPILKIAVKRSNDLEKKLPETPMDKLDKIIKKFNIKDVEKHYDDFRGRISSV